MKLLIFAARILLGLAFFVFGLNHIVIFLHGPMPAGDAGTLFTVMTAHRWFIFYGRILLCRCFWRCWKFFWSTRTATRSRESSVRRQIPRCGKAAS
jgi:hypothetical protein